MTTPGFGTAGLRARMGPGPDEFNEALVARASYGVASYLTHHQISGPVVVGYDARRGSAGFAASAAAVLAGTGRAAMLLPRALPTPVLAFAVRALDAAAGVMITASHNPAADNGYKLYLADGAQVAPPADAEIEAAMAHAPDIPPRGTATVVAESLVAAYVERGVAALDPGGFRDLHVAHTALHGVAAETFRQVWAGAGFPPFVAVAEQAEPDPDFPTVAFPNPEEPGALDLAAALAARVHADLVLAHDPDGDRCAVMVPDGTGYRLLTGDEVGVLLAEHLLARGRIPADGVLASTIVSSPQLERVAAAHGRVCVRTLTGFKWLARVPRLAYAYEEALGYCADPAAVRDKDGLTAALLVSELAASARAEGRTLTDLLDALAHRDGLVVGAAHSIRTADTAAVARVLADLLVTPPPVLGSWPVRHVQDLGAGADGLPPTPGVRLLADGLRAVVRPSGTEPKLKVYLHANADPPFADLTDARAELSARLDAAAADLLARLRPRDDNS